MQSILLGVSFPDLLDHPCRRLTEGYCYEVCWALARALCKNRMNDQFLAADAAVVLTWGVKREGPSILMEVHPA
jgi:hypothetical protein